MQSLGRQKNGPRDPPGPSSGVREAWVKLVTRGSLSVGHEQKKSERLLEIGTRSSDAWHALFRHIDGSAIGTKTVVAAPSCSCCGRYHCCSWRRSLSADADLLSPFPPPNPLSVLLRRPPLMMRIRDFDCRACWSVGRSVSFVHRGSFGSKSLCHLHCARIVTLPPLFSLSLHPPLLEKVDFVDRPPASLYITCHNNNNAPVDLFNLSRSASLPHPL
jgi:hypothetical protein